MLNLVLITDKLQLITSAAVVTHVHASWVDLPTGSDPSPGKTNTAISTATTTDIVAAPGSSTVRNIRKLIIRNTGAAENDVTVVYNQNGTSFQLYKTTLKAGESLVYTEEIGFVQQAAVPDVLASASAGDIVANAADTYLSASALAISGRIQAGTFIWWRFVMTKTAAGVATPIYNVRVGTNGTVADTARCTFTGVAQTAAADTGWHEIALTVREVSATGVIHGNMTMEHRLTTTGLQNAAQIQILQSLSGTFDLTVAGLIIGVSCNPGAAGVWTFQHISVRAFNLAS